MLITSNVAIIQCAGAENQEKSTVIGFWHRLACSDMLELDFIFTKTNLDSDK